IQQGKPAALVAQLKSSQAGTNGIRIHEARFVLGDAPTSEERKAPEPAKGNRSADSGSMRDRQPDLQKSVPPTVLTAGSHGGPRIASAAPDNGHNKGGEIGAGTRPEASP